MVSHASRAAFHDGESVPALRAGARLRRHRVARGVPRVRRRQGEAPGHGGAGAPDGVGRSSRGGGAQSRPSPSRERRYPRGDVHRARARLVPGGRRRRRRLRPALQSRRRKLRRPAQGPSLGGDRAALQRGRITPRERRQGHQRRGVGRRRRGWPVSPPRSQRSGHRRRLRPVARGSARRRRRATRHVQQGRHRSRVGPRHATLRADGRRARCRVLVPRPRSRRSTTRRRERTTIDSTCSPSPARSTTVSTRTPTPLPASIRIPTRRRRRRRGDRSRM